MSASGELEFNLADGTSVTGQPVGCALPVAAGFADDDQQQAPLVQKFEGDPLIRLWQSADSSFRWMLQTPVLWLGSLILAAVVSLLWSLAPKRASFRIKSPFSK